jgi:chromosome segregation ATPase
MNILEDIAIWIMGSITAIGVFAGGLGFIISQFKDGKNKDKVDTLNNDQTLLNYFKEKNEGYAQAVVDLQKQIADLNSKIAVLSATIVERDKQLSDYKAIFTGTDTGTKTFQATMLQSVKDRENFQEKTAEILESIVERLEVLSTGQSDAKEHAALPVNITAQLTQ